MTKLKDEEERSPFLVVTVYRDGGGEDTKMIAEVSSSDHFLECGGCRGGAVAAVVRALSGALEMADGGSFVRSEAVTERVH